MSSSTRPEVIANIEATLRSELKRTGMSDQVVAAAEVEVFFADELLFASVTVRDGEAVAWRSSHAATPESGSVAELAVAGEELVERIVADADASLPHSMRAGSGAAE